AAYGLNSRSSGKPKPLLPSVTDIPRHAPAPSAPPGCAPQGRTCSLSCSSGSILLGSESLRQTRCGSDRQPAPDQARGQQRQAVSDEVRPEEDDATATTFSVC